MKKEPKLSYDKGKCLRLFGGPNGSGKSTIIELIKTSFDVGYYINPDEIEVQLRKSGRLNLQDFGMNNNDPISFDQFLNNHPIKDKAQYEGFEISLNFKDNHIDCGDIEGLSYEAALIADFIRTQLIARGKKLTFESVMSHPSKIDILEFANSHRYKTYLYFICTSSPEINIERVNLRVKKGGHAVLEEKIVKRYSNSLELLKQAVANTYRSFIWDNLGKKPELILEVFNGTQVTPKTNTIPEWVDKYLLSKV